MQKVLIIVSFFLSSLTIASENKVTCKQEFKELNPVEWSVLISTAIRINERLGFSTLVTVSTHETSKMSMACVVSRN